MSAIDGRKSYHGICLRGRKESHDTFLRERTGIPLTIRGAASVIRWSYHALNRDAFTTTRQSKFLSYFGALLSVRRRRCRPRPALSTASTKFAGDQRLAPTIFDIENYCIPAGASLGQAVDVFCKYLKDNPEERHLPASVLAAKSLGLAWPCKQFPPRSRWWWWLPRLGRYSAALPSADSVLSESHKTSDPGRCRVPPATLFYPDLKRRVETY